MAQPLFFLLFLQRGREDDEDAVPSPRSRHVVPTQAGSDRFAKTSPADVFLAVSFSLSGSVLEPRTGIRPTLRTTRVLTPPVVAASGTGKHLRVARTLVAS
jgi:hypothetical protein